jgi:hypothetical protein
MTWSEATTPSTSNSDDAPSPGTAIVRPLRHVQAVREHHMLRFATPADATASRSARAWAWALGETSLSPVTNQETSAPPTHEQVQAEISVADDRRLHGVRQDRADAAATILRWLIGEDDHVPVRCDNPGELVGGFGDIVRSRQQILSVMEKVVESRQTAALLAGHPSSEADSRREAQQHVNYCDGVLATLGWVLGDRKSPFTQMYRSALTSKDLKAERLHAEDVRWHAERRPTGEHYMSGFGYGASVTITWLLGDRTTVLPAR